MSKWGFILLAVFPLAWILVIGLAFAGSISGMMGDSLSLELDVDVSGYEEIEEWDTHGDFHGDGSRYVRLTFDDRDGEELEKEIQGQTDASGFWHELPMSERVYEAVYGEDLKTGNGSSRGPLVTDDTCETPAAGESRTLFPKVEDGYYYFCDRYNGAADPGSDQALFTRMAYNFTVAVYDKAAKTLYYYELDT